MLSNIPRISREQHYLQMVKLIAERSGCMSRHVGALITNEGRIIASGYNSAPRGFKNCYETGICLRKNDPSGQNLNTCYAVHAEQNAIAAAAYFGIATEGCTMYLSCHPCASCAKLILQAGIKEVIYMEDYPDEFAKRLFAESPNIIIRQVILQENAI